MKRVVVTGAAGLLGWHAHARLHAANCAARFAGAPRPFNILALDHDSFDDDATLGAAVTGADAVLHFAGVNSWEDEGALEANPAIARRLVCACDRAKADPQIVYANSIHAALDTRYGRSKRQAGQLLASRFSRYTELVLPHIFGEGARSFYNNITATFIHQVLSGDAPEVDPEGQVNLLHAGRAVQAAIDAVISQTCAQISPAGRPMSVPALYDRLRGFDESYRANIFPDVSDAFDLALFNTYRAATYPDGWPRALMLNSDARGTLFEAVRGGGGGQTFLSITKAGVTRGDHFHLDKVERFLVVRGDAVIRLRKVLTDEVWEYRVSGDVPAVVDMPTLHTHSIENTGTGELLTLFWAHELFDPARPDTYADKVLP